MRIQTIMVLQNFKKLRAITITWRCFTNKVFDFVRTVNLMGKIKQENNKCKNSILLKLNSHPMNSQLENLQPGQL